MGHKFCINCGNKGHIFYECHNPITSIGIILYNIKNDNINFLMIRRKHTIGYIELIRGKYNTNNLNYINKLLSVISLEERILIMNNDYEYLWKNLWQLNNINKNKNYLNNENKFNKLKNGFFINNNFINFKILLNNIPSWNETEWEFPKGKRKYNENEYTAAYREFNEETGIENINNLNIKFIENYKGINNLKYRNIYYLAKTNNEIIPKINYRKKNQYCEISKIQWFNYKNAIHKIRNYYPEKKKILNRIFNYILEIENINIINNE